MLQARHHDRIGDVLNRPTVACAIVTMAIAIVMSSCGGGGSEDGTFDQAAKDSREEDQTRAEGIVLVLADFPTGWRAVQGDDEAEPPKCFGFDLFDLTMTGRAESSKFAQGEVTAATSGAAIFASERDAVAAFERLANQDLADCYASWLRERSDDDVRVDVSASELSFPTFGDRSAAYQVTAELQANALPPSVLIDLVFIQEERALAILIFLDVFSAFSSSEMEDLAGLIAGRMGPP